MMLFHFSSNDGPDSHLQQREDVGDSFIFFTLCYAEINNSQKELASALTWFQ